jgi:hypothetical protein
LTYGPESASSGAFGARGVLRNDSAENRPCAFADGAATNIVAHTNSIPAARTLRSFPFS